MDIIFSIMLLGGMCYGAYRGLKWMLRTGQARPLKSDALSPADLKVLEESASRLTADLKAAADECVARIEAACANADRKIACLAALASTGSTGSHTESEPVYRSIFDVIQVDAPLASTASEPSVLPGEAALIRDLRAIHRED